MQVLSTCANDHLIAARLLFPIRKWVYCKHLFISHLWFHYCRLLSSPPHFNRYCSSGQNNGLCTQFSRCSFRTGWICCRLKWNKASLDMFDSVCVFFEGGVALHPLMNMFIFGSKGHGILLLAASQCHVMGGGLDLFDVLPFTWKLEDFLESFSFLLSWIFFDLQSILHITTLLGFQILQNEVKQT